MADKHQVVAKQESKKTALAEKTTNSSLSGNAEQNHSILLTIRACFVSYAGRLIPIIIRLSGFLQPESLSYD
jgi:hypothetical protein